jgi:hypothetical protein
MQTLRRSIDGRPGLSRGAYWRSGRRRMREASIERCREQAAQHRRMAEAAEDPELKTKLLRIAQSYDEIADHILRLNRRREAAAPPPEDRSTSADEPGPPADAQARAQDETQGGNR